MGGVFAILALILWIFFVVLLIRLVFDFVQSMSRSWEPHGPLLVGLEVVYSVTDPPLKALRRLIPPLRLGGFGIDLGFIVLIIVLQVLIRVLQGVAT